MPAFLNSGTVHSARPGRSADRPGAGGQASSRPVVELRSRKQQKIRKKKVEKKKMGHDEHGHGSGASAAVPGEVSNCMIENINFFPGFLSCIYRYTLARVRHNHTHPFTFHLTPSTSAHTLRERSYPCLHGPL